MAEVTLEFHFVDYGSSSVRYDADRVLAPTPPDGGDHDIHMRYVVAEHLEAIPLCWNAEFQQKGGTVEDLEVAVDHESLPPYSVIDSPAFVTCQSCREWLHS